MSHPKQNPDAAPEGDLRGPAPSYLEPWSSTGSCNWANMANSKAKAKTPIREDFRRRGLPVLCITSVPAIWGVTRAWRSEGGTTGVLGCLPASPHQLPADSITQYRLPSPARGFTGLPVTRVIQPAGMTGSAICIKLILFKI